MGGVFIKNLSEKDLHDFILSNCSNFSKYRKPCYDYRYCKNCVEEVMFNIKNIIFIECDKGDLSFLGLLSSSVVYCYN